MLGTRRRCSLDSLERPPSKIPKEDALSIYEITLEKLRLGSRRASALSAEYVKTEALHSALPASPLTASPTSSTGSQTTESLEQMEEDSVLT